MLLLVILIKPLAGEVTIGSNTAIWYNTTIRGDLNPIRIGLNTSIGDHTTIHTVASVSTGTTASVNIGKNVIIGSHCSLCSCHIGDGCYIAHNCTILPGARLEDSCILSPGSVVPPGRLIPTNQVWGGNPVEYIRPLDYSEDLANYMFSYSHVDIGAMHKALYSFLPNAYMMKPATKEEYKVPEHRKEYYHIHDLEEALDEKYP